MSQTPNARVLVVHDKPLTRFGIMGVVDIHPLLSVCGEAGDARQARQLCAEEKSDIIVLSLVLPHGDGIELMREFARLHPPVCMLVISEECDLLTVQRAFRAGASGFLLMSEEPTELLTAFERVLTGGVFGSEKMALGLVQGFAEQGSTAPPADKGMDGLSDRELHIFRLIGRRFGPTAIAQELGVSVKTIETHQQRIKDKLHLRATSELRRRAEQWLAALAGGRSHGSHARKRSPTRLPKRRE